MSMQYNTTPYTYDVTITHDDGFLVLTIVNCCNEYEAYDKAKASYADHHDRTLQAKQIVNVRRVVVR